MKAQYIIPAITFFFFAVQSNAQRSQTEIDKQVREFLESKKGEWRYWNVPYQDGQVLYEIIVKNGYTSGLEIGTSTGHSTIWMAWAMSKTGGKVITIEIDEGRHKTAVDNIKKAGLEEYVDARQADAHELVKEIQGPFDFVFSDADKSWYTQYFKDIDPKLKVGGCFTAHNVSNSFGGASEFVEYIKSKSNYTTTIDNSSRSGISISYKKSE
ncbi:MAG: class I SAM-dependent methyltransferase [Cytophagales bacterium]|nr:class I SAM-dependent methyltransferase [Cytophagales bacterium]